MTALLVLLLPSAGYLLAVRRLRRRGDSWSVPRTAALLAGVSCLAVALLPFVQARDEDFRVHAGQHLLLSSAAPLLLALAAPFTLALRALHGRARRGLLLVLHSAPARFVLRGPVVLALDAAGLWLVYLSPLWELSLRSEIVHSLVHIHVLVAGCLLAWYAVAADPLPHRPSVTLRLGILVMVAASHEVLAHVLWVRGLPGVISVRAGAEIMAYGGDVVELMLVVTLLSGWYAAGGRQLRRELRRGGAQPAGTTS